MDLVQLTANIDTLKIPDPIKKDLGAFVQQLIAFYHGDLISVMAFGSCVSGDYNPGFSDVNLMVVHSDLNIADLNVVADFAKKWLEKRNFAPRFLSRRNLLTSDKYFQIDMLGMKDSHVVLLGEELLKNIEIIPKNLLWQVCYEIKAMRSRIKQQFWRTAGDARSIRFVLVSRFTSLIHVIRALLYLMGKETPVSTVKIMEVACKELGLNEAFVSNMFSIKVSRATLDKDQALHGFVSLMEAIRLVDECADKVRL